jgi:3-oxoacyl-(acyl-carrier-protein) synthase
MMHIIDISCISPQDTYGEKSFNSEVIPHVGHQYLAIEPDYKSFISRGALRRMGKASRLGIGAGQPLIQRYPNVDGIIISTGNGGLGECVQFLDQIIKYDEGTLTPTHFVNSTANSISGSLALSSKNKGYNATFVGHGFGFESALLDALMHFEEGDSHSFLVGNVDEISEYNSNIERHRGLFKAEETTSNNLLESTTKGTVVGEGAAMFIVSNNPQNKLASVLDVAMILSSNTKEIQ